MAEEKVDKSKKTEAEIMAEIQEAMAKTPVKDFILHFVMTLSSIAYQRLGVYQDPDKTKIDLKEAKLAIDTFESLVNGVEKALTAEELKSLKEVLSSLKMVYVQKKDKKTS